MTTTYDNETVRYRLKYVLQVIDRDRTIAATARDAIMSSIKPQNYNLKNLSMSRAFQKFPPTLLESVSF